MTLFWPTKDPQEVLDYDIDWSERLVDDTIVASTWAVDDATLTIDNDVSSDTATKVWLSGGTLAAQYILTNTITTAEGRTMEQSVKLRIKAR